MKIKHLIISFIILLISNTILVAQDYNTGIGLRGGFTSGITFKNFVSEKAAIEGIVASRWRGFSITGLYELHANTIFEVERLNLYYGGGAHIGFWNGNYNPWFTNTNVSYTVVGVDGIIGFEYNFSEAPINVSIDWKPVINFIGYYGFWAAEGAFSVRYVF